MKHEELKFHKLQFIQLWVRVIREGSEKHMFKDSEDKHEEGRLR